MATRTKKLSVFPDLLQIGNTNTRNVKFPLLDLRESDPSKRNKNIKFDTLKDEILNRNTIPSVLYVNKRGDDGNDGRTINSAKLTLKSALQSITNSPFFNKTQDAADLILSNKAYIVDEAFIRLRSRYPDLYPNPTSSIALRCRRDLGYILESVVKDLRLGGNLNVIEAAASYYDTTQGSSRAALLSDISRNLDATQYAFTQVRELMKYALDGWRGYSGGTSQVLKYFPTYNTDIIGSVNNVNITENPVTYLNSQFPTAAIGNGIIDLLTNSVWTKTSGSWINKGTAQPIINGDCSDIKSAIQTYFDIIFSILTNNLDTITVSSGPINTTIYVAPGTYIEDNPLYVPPNVTIVGDNLRSTNIVPLHPTKDIFWVNNGVYITGFSFSGHVDGAAVVAFPDSGAGVIVRSPYIQNCTSLTSTGTGMRVDGYKASGLKSMVLDSFSQYNQGGIGIEIVNGGYAQLVSIFEICCDKAVYVNNGATCSITNSNTDFGNYGLYAEGVSPQQYTTSITGAELRQRLIIQNDDDINGLTFRISGIPEGQKPYVGQGITIGDQFYFIKEINIVDGGAGYSFPPEILLAPPSQPEGIPAELLTEIDDNGSVTNVVVAVSGTLFRIQDFAAPGSYYEDRGRIIWDPTAPGALNDGFIQYVDPPTGPGARPFQIQVVMEPIFFTVASSTPRDQNGVCEVTILEKIPFVPVNDPITGLGPLVKFFQLSRMIVSSHCFEYVGSGTNISDAVPAKGGVPIQKNEVFTKNGARIVFTSTDHIGNFRIGPDLVINQDTGTLTGRTFDKSLFSKLTPFILAVQ